MNAFRLLGVQFNSLSNLDGMPFYVLNPNYFEHLPELIIMIFRASPIGIYLINWGYDIPEY